MRDGAEMLGEKQAAPNTRVQRTRSSPSALRSPLTRCPLGGRGAREQGDDMGLVPVEFRTGEMI